MILSHICFASDGGVGGSNAVLIIQAGRTDKHDDQASRLWRECRKIICNPKSLQLRNFQVAKQSNLPPNCAKMKYHSQFHFFYQYLNPTTKTNRCCAAYTLTVYVGKYIKHMRNIDTDLPNWKYLCKDEPRFWWLSMNQACYGKASGKKNQVARSL